MRSLLESAEQAAASDGTILLVGEGGSGKSLLARQIHLWSARRSRSFSIINCSTLSQQIYGGDRSDRHLSVPLMSVQRGLTTFNITEGGTLLLASIEDLPLALQVEFAQFVQDRTLRTVGGERTIDVRIIATANRDLATEVTLHHFREDLFYALNIISLRVPPLRERPSDILPLAARMLVIAAMRNHRTGLQLSRKAAETLTQYHWPGNLRELRNAMESAAVLCDGGVVTPAHLPEALAKHKADKATATSTGASLDQIEREHITRVLGESSTLKQAAVTLGISPSTLWRKRTLYDIDVAISSKTKKAV
ncbi:MAG TPA: sigma 54-interacting transcriptional regulator [Candidatus Binataceae bacterium]|nr:sigma 54-interacting transcriptional regulator [Candidatus Binataceae bacterium]